MPQSPSPLLILGASTRAAAQSAVRAGFQPYCADVFADEDLREIAVVHPVSIDNYPESLIEIADKVPPAPWMYTGAMENYPDIVQRISAKRPLWGNPADVIKRSRDPFLTYEALHSAGLPVPRVRSSDNPPEPDGKWMLKPERSGGGRGIRIWDESASDSRTLDEPHWFQQRAEGLSLAAIFVAMEHDTILAGISRQLVGNADGSGPTYGYTGSIAPYGLSDEVRREVERMGRVLTEAAGLRGIFGVDFLLNDEGAWPVDLNPRYSASVEVIEQVYDWPLLSCHARSFRGHGGSLRAISRGIEPGPPRRFVGKTILFADEDIIVPDLIDVFGESNRQCGLDEECAILADRPAAGSTIAAGKPICSVIVSGGSESRCRKRLGEHVRRVRIATTGVDRPVVFE